MISALQPHPPAANRTQAVERFGKLGAPGPHQPGQTDNLPGVNLKAEIDKALPGERFHAQHGKILRLGAAVARQRQPQLLRIAQGCFPAYRRHGGDQGVIVKMRSFAAEHHRAVAHH